jgi:hypothetical protein
MHQLLIGLIMLCSVAGAQVLPAKYATNDGRIALFLEATAEGLSAGLGIGHGLLLPIDAQLDSNQLTGTVGDDVRIEGTFEGDTLHLSLEQDGERQAFVLSHQVGKADVSDAAPLLDLLSLVPDTLTVREGTPLISFANFRSAVADSPSQPQTREDFAAMQDEERQSWFAALRRLRSGPTDLLQYALPMIETMPELLGFEWFDIDAALSYGTPPRMGMLLTVADSSEALAEHLRSREFEETTFEGVTIWQRQADGQVNIARREPGDPFVGPLGMAARIAVLPEHLLDDPLNGRYLSWQLSVSGSST